MKLKQIRRVLLILTALATLAGAVPAAAEKTILLTFTGDCTIGGQEKTRGLPDSFDTVAAEKGYGYFFENFRDIFEKDDLTVINLEGVLSDSKAYEAKKKYRFRGKTEFAQILTEGHIDAASLSNNHIADYGKQGDSSTKKTLEDNGILWFQGMKYAKFEKDGVTIALFALDNTIVFNSFDKFLNLMKSVKANGEADAVVVCWHTGKEYYGFHEKKTEKNANIMIESGADLIIINHTHTAQGVSVYNNRCVFYSLGNFVFGGNSIIRGGRKSKDELAINLYGELVQAKLTFADDGKYLGQQMTVYPVFSSGEYPVNNYQPRLLSLDEAVPVAQAMQRDTAFELPKLTEKDGIARIEFSYMPAFDTVMVPEETEADGPKGIPEAASPTPTRNNKGN